MTARISNRAADAIEHLLRRHEKKEKTSVSLSGEIIKAADILAGKAQRSALIEKAVRTYLRRTLRRHRNERDINAIDFSASVTNRESDRLPEIQSWPE